MSKNVSSNIVLLIIILVGAILRFVNITPFKIYPDSYQSLIVAKNISEFKSVIGLLGENGVFYPPYFMWSRPGYPLLIDLLSFATRERELSAVIIAFTAGVLGIIISFFLLKSIFKSNVVALSGAALLALSFNHTIWSGFIMTETLGVLLVLILLFALFKTYKQKTKAANLIDIITGIILGFCILTRYEYSLLIVPIFFLIYQGQDFKIRIINIFSGALYALASLLFYISCFHYTGSNFTTTVFTN